MSFGTKSTVMPSIFGVGDEPIDKYDLLYINYLFLMTNLANIVQMHHE